MAKTLAISHNLFLDKNQRYDWYNGKEVSIIGVSVPVWINKTIKPAVEVFCKYKLSLDTNVSIKMESDCYRITSPQQKDSESTLSPDILNSLSDEELSKWFKHSLEVPAISNLLDIKDGGVEWMAFRQYSKIIDKNNKILNMIHYVEIKKIENLLESLE